MFGGIASGFFGCKAFSYNEVAIRSTVLGPTVRIDAVGESNSFRSRLEVAGRIAVCIHSAGSIQLNEIVINFGAIAGEIDITELFTGKCREIKCMLVDLFDAACNFNTLQSRESLENLCSKFGNAFIDYDIGKIDVNAAKEGSKF